MSGVPSFVTRIRVPMNSSPVIANGVAWFGAEDHRLRAVDAATGKLLTVSVPFTVTRSSPIVADGRVFFGTETGYVICMQ